MSSNTIGPGTRILETPDRLPTDLPKTIPPVETTANRLPWSHPPIGFHCLRLTRARSRRTADALDAPDNPFLIWSLLGCGQLFPLGRSLLGEGAHLPAAATPEPRCRYLLY